MKLVALIPCHNEEDRIADTISSLQNINRFDEIIVIDDGSRDRTSEIASEYGVRVIRLLYNVGKGAALEHGAKRAEDADIIALLDGDLGSSVAEVSLLLEPVLAGEADMAVAGFPKAKKAGFGLVKKLAQEAFDRYNTGFKSSAPLSGQRVMTAECMDAVRPFASGYGVEVIMTLKALDAGYNITEVPTEMSHAATGRDLKGFIHRGRQYVQIKLALRKYAKEKKALDKLKENGGA